MPSSKGLGCKKVKFLPLVTGTGWDECVPVCRHINRITEAFLNVLFGLYRCDFLHVELREKKKNNWGRKGKAIFFSYKCLRPIIVRCVKVLNLQKGLSNSKQGEEIYFWLARYNLPKRNLKLGVPLGYFAVKRDWRKISGQMLPWNTHTAACKYLGRNFALVKYKTLIILANFKLLVINKFLS